MGSLKTGAQFGVLAAVIVIAGFWFFQSAPNAVGEINANNGVAIEGYDSFAYFKKRAAVKGSPVYSFKWRDAEWHFVSAENRDLFASNPERWAPLYGGY